MQEAYNLPRFHSLEPVSSVVWETGMFVALVA